MELIVTFGAWLSRYRS